MTRPRIIAVLLLASALPLAAQEALHSARSRAEDPAPVFRLDDRAIAAEGRTWQVPLGGEQATETSSGGYVTDAGFLTSLAGNNGCCDQCGECGCECEGGCEQNCFHPVDACRCRIPNLDPWCYCETTCCTTDEWCANPCQCSHGNCYRTEDGCWMCNDAQCDVQGKSFQPFTDPIRFGWWSVSSSGSTTKTGEFQSLKSSPFFDVDTLLSDGTQTLDLTLSGLDNEAHNVRARFYSPNMKADFSFQRFFRQLDHDPPTTFQATPPGTVPAANIDVVTTDLNVGQDYAIRVDQMDARFSGRLGADNVKWKLNLWGMHKFGERQANAVGHCFNFNANNSAANSQNIVCHVLSQRQGINWLTQEVQPGVEANFGAVSFEYTKTVRTFDQSDEIVGRQYTRFDFNLPAANNLLGPVYDYAITPENITHIDRLKMNAQLTPDNVLYANMYIGSTKNEFRNTHRDMSGWDVRLTNTAYENLTLTGYASDYTENNELPPFFFSGAPLSTPNMYDRTESRHPVEYQRLRGGINGRWTPQGQDSMWRNLSWAGGYEYYLISRDWATYQSARLGTFIQPDTNNHQFEIGPQMQWSPSLRTHLRYRALFSEYPLIGVRESSGRLNSNLPEQSHRVDIGGSWQPTDYFLATAQVSIVNSWQTSQYARFNENSYPFNLTAWAAITDQLSITGGYAYFTNWIDQDIGIGFRTAPYESQQWSYSGQNHLANIAAIFAATPALRLSGGYEWNRGSNVTYIPPSISGGNWSQLSSYFDVVVVTQRLYAGVDWQPHPNLETYVRYNFFDFSDIGAGFDSGTTNMILGGFSLIF